jgi:hypothetical protein
MAARLGAGRRVFDFLQGKDTFMFSTASKPALGSTQPLVQRISKLRGRGVKPTTHLHLVPKSRILELYVQSTTRLHGVVLKYIIKYGDNFTYTEVTLK